MKNLLASTAIVMASATAAFADTNVATPFSESAMGEVLYASDLVGARLYVSESETDELEARADWDDVGEINDIIVGKDGMVQHVLADIGGFLGLGEKRIAVSMESLQFVSDGNDATDYFIVLNGSREALENAPEFNPDMDPAEQTAEANMEQEAEEMTAEAETELEQAGDAVANAADEAVDETQEAVQEAEAEITNDQSEEIANAQAEVTEEKIEGQQEVANAETAEEANEEMVEATEETNDAKIELAEENAEAMENDNTMVATERKRFVAPMIERDGYEAVAFDTLTTEDVTGARVFDANDEWIGEVNSLVMSEDGKLTEAIIDVGGFLGLGEKQVELSMDELNIQRGDGDLRIYLDATEEQLEQMPEWQG